MDTNIFKSKFEAAVASAKKSKATGTQVSAKIYMNSGVMHQFTQTGGSWWKYEIDEGAGTLQIGNRSTAEPTSQTASEDLQYKSVRTIDISQISGFDIDYLTPTTATTTEATETK